MNDKCFRPKDFWKIANQHINFSQLSLLICNDTVLSKTRSQKNKLVNYQYSGNAQDFIVGIALSGLALRNLLHESTMKNILTLENEIIGYIGIQKNCSISFLGVK